MEDLIQKEMERLAGIRMQLLEMHPFWGYLLLQMELIPAPELPYPAATDMLRHIWFNPRETETLSMSELGFVLLHEISHQVLATDTRQNGRNHFIWNQATDYVINGMVRDIRHPFADRELYQMPEGALWDRRLSYMTAETVYEELCRRKNNQHSCQITIILPRSGSGDGDSGNEQEQNSQQAVAELQLVDHQGGIDIHVGTELTESQLEELKDRLGAALENYEANQQRGDLPGEYLRSIGLLDKPKVPWQRVMRRYIDTALNSLDYSLARPHKRFQTEGFVVPGKYSETVSAVVAALDTSGSMSAEELRKAASEIAGMVPNTEELTFITADARIQQVFGPDELDEALKKCKFKGGGGTDHCCVFDYIRKHRLQPRLFVGMSDLYSSFPSQAPGYPVLWLVPKDHNDAPWGKIIEL